MEYFDQQLIGVTLEYYRNTMTQGFISYCLIDKYCELSRSGNSDTSFATKRPGGACLANHLFCLTRSDS